MRGWSKSGIPSLLLLVDQFVCRTEAIADIVILVDGSWSIGRLNFRLVRMFLENLVNAFDVGIDKTRIGGSLLSPSSIIGPTLDQWNILPNILLISYGMSRSWSEWCRQMTTCVCVNVFPGLAQYSGDPRIEWHLNTFSTKDTVIDAVKNLPYKGGNTLTGALSYSCFLIVFS